MYLSADLLTAAKVLAATSGRSESQVVEDALRTYLRGGQLDATRVELLELMDRIAAERDTPSDDEAMSTAIQEVRSVRRKRRTKSA